MRMAPNLSNAACRKSKSHGEDVAVEDGAVENVVLIDAAPPTDDVMLAKERKARLGICLLRLTPKTREIFLSHRLEELTYQEIATRHGLSVSSFQKHVAKATLQLSTWIQGW